MAELDGAPLTAKVITAHLSKERGQQVSDSQIRRALYGLSDRGVVELRIQANPFGRPGICVFLPGVAERFDALHLAAFGHRGRPVRPPKPRMGDYADQIGELCRAAVHYAHADLDDDDEFHAAVADLIVTAMHFNPPRSILVAAPDDDA